MKWCTCWPAASGGSTRPPSTGSVLYCIATQGELKFEVARFATIRLEKNQVLQVLQNLFTIQQVLLQNSFNTKKHILCTKSTNIHIPADPIITAKQVANYKMVIETKHQNKNCIHFYLNTFKTLETTGKIERPDRSLKIRTFKSLWKYNHWNFLAKKGCKLSKHFT